METEYPTYKLGLSLKRATWLVEWLRLLARTGKTEAKAFAQGLGRLGFASIALDCRYTLGRRPSRGSLEP